MSTSPLDRALRAARRRLEYSSQRSPEDNIRVLRDSLRKVSAALPVVQDTFPEQEAPSGVFEKSSVLTLPRRERDPALVQQEINGCKGLLLEIIRRAAYDWVLYRSSRRLFHRKLAEQAFHWLFREGPGHPDWEEREESEKQVTSFPAICSALDLDPDIVRAHVRKLTPKSVMSVGRPPEYRRRESAPQIREESAVRMSKSVAFEQAWAALEEDNFGDAVGDNF